MPRPGLSGQQETSAETRTWFAVAPRGSECPTSLFGRSASGGSAAALPLSDLKHRRIRCVDLSPGTDPVEAFCAVHSAALDAATTHVYQPGPVRPNGKPRGDVRPTTNPPLGPHQGNTVPFTVSLNRSQRGSTCPAINQRLRPRRRTHCCNRRSTPRPRPPPPKPPLRQGSRQSRRPPTPPPNRPSAPRQLRNPRRVPRRARRARLRPALPPRKTELRSRTGSLRSSSA